MQRKNYFLKPNPHKKRSGFAMIMAIAVIIIIATIMALSLALTTETSKRTVDLYLYEQAALHAKSATELALLDIAKNGCINNKNIIFYDESGTNPMYDANITMRYVYTGPTTNVAGVNCDEYISYIKTLEQNGSVLMDVTVSPRADQNLSTEPIRYFRRTIQKL
jgi:type II secretory pathway pseudopilin PulG